MHLLGLAKLFLICVLSGHADDYSNDNEDYVSLESTEQALINEVIDNDVNDYWDKYGLELESDKREQNNDIEAGRKLKPLKQRSSQVIVNTTAPYKCGEIRNSDSSEEERCKITLVNYPYSASIQKRGAHFASGALIDEQTILTAAREFFNVRESIKLYKVRLGSVDCKRGGVLLPIKSVDIHPSYVMGRAAFDVAVLKLASPVNVTQHIKPISLSRVTQKVISAKFRTTYWPRIIVHGELIPKTAKERVKHHSMRVSTQKLIPWKNCQHLMQTRGAKLDANSLCLKPIATHHSICTPDVGAPVVADDGLWGITSGWTSKHCRLYPSPTIFTRVSLKPIESWLADLM